MEGREFAVPSYEERLDLVLDYAAKLSAYTGEHVGMRMMRSMAPWYLVGMPMAKQYKNRLAYIETAEDIQKIISEYRETLREIAE